jgi:hypothetical protein
MWWRLNSGSRTTRTHLDTERTSNARHRYPDRNYAGRDAVIRSDQDTPAGRRRGHYPNATEEEKTKLHMLSYQVGELHARVMAEEEREEGEEDR